MSRGGGVAAELKREHRGIGYPEAGYAAHPELVVDHVGVVRAHRGRADGVIEASAGG